MLPLAKPHVRGAAYQQRQGPLPKLAEKRVFGQNALKVFHLCSPSNAGIASQAITPTLSTAISWRNRIASIPPAMLHCRRLLPIPQTYSLRVSASPREEEAFGPAALRLRGCSIE